MRYVIILIFLSFNLIATTLHLSISANPSRVNPILATDSASGTISGWIFNSLITYDKDGKIKLELAKSYRFLDERTLVFELRDDIFWHDGKRVSAQDVVFTYETIISPKIFTPYADSFKHIKSVKALNQTTVEVIYKYPYFKALETWMLGILPSHILQNEDNLMTSSFNQHPIGNGPYKMKGFSISQDIELFANENYFIHKPNIDKIVYHFIPDPSTQFLMLKSHQLDVGSLSPLQIERQIDDDFKRYYAIYEDISHGYTYMGFNLKNKKFKDPRIRKALSLAIDRQELVDILFFGHAKVCNGPFMPGTFAYNENVKAPKQDIKRAKELLKEAGFDENNPFEFEVITNSNNSIRTYALQIMQHQMKLAGINMKIRTMEWQAFLNTVVMPRNFEAVVLGWSLGLMPDAYSIWHSESAKKGGFNFVSYKNKEVDKLIKKAEKTVDKKKLGTIYKKIFKLITDDNPYLFLFIPNSITVVNKEIKNVSASIIGVMHNTIDWIKP